MLSVANRYSPTKTVSAGDSFGLEEGEETSASAEEGEEEVSDAAEGGGRDASVRMGLNGEASFEAMAAGRISRGGAETEGREEENSWAEEDEGEEESRHVATESHSCQLTTLIDFALLVAGAIARSAAQPASDCSGGGTEWRQSERSTKQQQAAMARLEGGQVQQRGKVRGLHCTFVRLSY